MCIYMSLFTCINLVLFCSCLSLCLCLCAVLAACCLLLAACCLLLAAYFYRSPLSLPWLLSLILNAIILYLYIIQVLLETLSSDDLWRKFVSLFVSLFVSSFIL